jgi:hypothetical protein
MRIWLTAKHRVIRLGPEKPTLTDTTDRKTDRKSNRMCTIMAQALGITGLQAEACLSACSGPVALKYFGLHIFWQ